MQTVRLGNFDAEIRPGSELAKLRWSKSIEESIVDFLYANKVKEYPVVVVGRNAAMFVDEMVVYPEGLQGDVEDRPNPIYPPQDTIYRAAWDCNFYYAALDISDHGHYALISPYINMWAVLFEDGCITDIFDSQWAAVNDAINTFNIDMELSIDEILRRFCVMEKEAGWPNGWFYDLDRDYTSSK